MIFFVYLLFVVKCIFSDQQTCMPFGLRLNYGRIIYNDSQQKLGIRFNTKLSCPQIVIIINNQTIIPCSSQRKKYYLANYRSTQIIYTTYIHKCNLSNEINFDEEFSYNLINTDNNELVMEESIKIYLKNPKNSFQTFSFLHIADWGPITNDTLRQRLEQSTPHLLNHILRNKVDAIILNGDIGYQLNSNEQFHEKVMNELSLLASRVPIIINRGNHEVNDKYSNVGTMFQEYFQIYEQQLKDCTRIKIGKTIFIMVDPFKLLIPRKYSTFTEEQLQKSLKNFIEILNTTEVLSNNAIILSHYPLVCGFPAVEHCIPDQTFNQMLPLYINLKGFYDAVLKFNVSLVLSGHVHTYERTFPMLTGYRTKTSEQSIYNQRDYNFFIQIIEGCSGSNDGILNSTNQLIQKQYLKSKMSAKIDIDRSGYGLLHTNNTNFIYEHFSIELNGDPFITDKLSITLREEKQSRLQSDL